MASNVHFSDCSLVFDGATVPVNDFRRRILVSQTRLHIGSLVAEKVRHMFYLFSLARRGRCLQAVACESTAVRFSVAAHVRWKDVELRAIPMGSRMSSSSSNTYKVRTAAQHNARYDLPTFSLAMYYEVRFGLQKISDSTDRQPAKGEG